MNADSNSAYLAGLIDGEGCIHISEKTRWNHSYQVKMVIGMSVKAEDLLRWVQQEFGGRLNYKRRTAGHKHQDVVMWNVHGKELARVLARILPYLRLKRPHAEIVLRLLALREGRWQKDWTPEESEIGALLKAELNSLNRVGRPLDVN